MANYSTLISAIQAVIKQNGNNEITGEILQQALIAMVASLGAGYQFAGVATPDINPGTPDQKVFYIASNGTFPNFGPTTVPPGYLGIFKYDSSWHYETLEFPIGDGTITTQKIADGAINEIKLALSLSSKLFNSGYKFMGVATPQTNPGTPQQYVFYMASPGTFPNFDNLVVPDESIGFLKWGGSWSLEYITLEVGLKTQPSYDINADLEFCDPSGNVLVRFKAGEIITKFFASYKTPYLQDVQYVDLAIQDEGDNVLLELADGHIRTKNFNSRYLFRDLSTKKINCLGDSITYGHISSGNRANPTWPQSIANNLGCEVNNYGVNGTSICSGSSESFVTRLNNMAETTIDMLLIAGGTNDYGDRRATVIGAITDTPAEGTNFIAAFKYLIEQAINKYPSAIIGIITPMRRQTESANSYGITLPQIVEAEIAVANLYGCPIYDLYHYGTINPGISIYRTNYTTDGLHPNQAGYDHFLSPQMTQFVLEHINFL